MLMFLRTFQFQMEHKLANSLLMLRCFLQIITNVFAKRLMTSIGVTIIRLPFS